MSSQQEMMTQQHNQQLHSQMQHRQFATMEEVEADYLRELTNSPLNEGTTDILENMLSQDWVLAYFQAEEVEEVKWLLKIIEKQVLDMHPPEKSVVTGKLRAYVCNDAEEQLEPLRQRQELFLRQFFNGVYARISRARDGWQQDKMNESIARSEVNNGKGGDSSVWDRLSFS